MLSPGDLPDVGSTGSQLGAQPLVAGIRARPDECLAHLADDGFGATDMVGVKVGEHEQVDVRDAKLVKARSQSRRTRTGIDGGNLVAVANEQCVALTDIALSN